jgi:hypothetical protein
LATEKQIAANRANAKRSTGPKTAAGKLRSSRNSFRHGLSAPAIWDPAASAKMDLIAGDLASSKAARDPRTSAAEFAEAQMEVLRIRAIRNEQWASISQQEDEEFNPKDLKRLAALDRYERYALTKRRKASKKLNP